MKFSLVPIKKNERKYLNINVDVEDNNRFSKDKEYAYRNNHPHRLYYISQQAADPIPPHAKPHPYPYYKHSYPHRCY